jgi:hypothetical protein
LVQVDEYDRWERISDWVSRGGERARTGDACKEHLVEMTSAGASDDDDAGEVKGVQNGLGQAASIIEKMTALANFEDPTLSCVVLVLLFIIGLLVTFVPANYIVWAIGMKLVLKKSPMTDAVREIRSRVSWLKNPEPDSKMGPFWYRRKYANRRKYGHMPPLLLGNKCSKPLAIIWHAPSRARNHHWDAYSLAFLKHA